MLPSSHVIRGGCSASHGSASHQRRRKPSISRWTPFVQPSASAWSGRISAASVQALLAANAALGLPATLGGLDSWYDGGTFSLEARTPALMYGPSSIDRAHTVGEWVPIADLVACAQGLALAAWRLCR